MFKPLLLYFSYTVRTSIISYFYFNLLFFSSYFIKGNSGNMLIKESGEKKEGVVCRTGWPEADKGPAKNTHTCSYL